MILASAESPLCCRREWGVAGRAGRLADTSSSRATPCALRPPERAPKHYQVKNDISEALLKIKQASNDHPPRQAGTVEQDQSIRELSDADQHSYTLQLRPSDVMFPRY
jgi:hypothetical protein